MGTEQYEVTQKAVKKYQASVADNMAQKEDSQQQLDDSKTTASERLASIKQEQSAAVKQARVTRVDMKADKVKESGAKQALKVHEATMESGSKKTAELRGQLANLEAEKKRREGGEVQHELKVAKKKLSG